jgi:tripartite-type tricarboxylate transporter receptor subunit TctC
MLSMLMRFAVLLAALAAANGAGAQAFPAGPVRILIGYPPGGPAVQTILAGDTQLLFASAPSVMGFIKSGRLKPLVVATRKGSPAIPGIPGSEEAGVPSFEATYCSCV